MIDLENLTENAVETVFNLLPTAVHLGSVIRRSPGTAQEDYNPETDTAAEPLQVVPNVRMIKLGASEEEMAGTDITVEDIKVIIPAKDMLGLGIKTNDELMHEGTLYDIIKKKVLPVKTVYIVFCRAK